MEKRQIITRLDKIYRALSLLRYMPDDVEAPGIYEDLCMAGEWAEGIRSAWEEDHPDYLPGELERFGSVDGSISRSAIPTLMSVAVSSTQEDGIPEEIRNSLTVFVAQVDMLRDDIERYQAEHQDKLYGVPKELQNDQSIRLLDLCVKNRLLDDHYQPLEEIKPFQLKLIAHAISSTTGSRPAWRSFEKLWSLEYELKGVSVPVTKPRETDQVLRLFPGVGIPIPERTDQVFKSNRSNSNLLQLFRSLQDGGYIGTQATERGWMVICGREAPDGTVAPIPWVSELRKLVILVSKLFECCGNDKIWARTINCFEVNGKAPNIGSLKSAKVWLQNNCGNGYDHILETLINTGV